MPSYDDDRQSGRCYGWLCAVLGILAGVGALYGAYYYYVSERKHMGQIRFVYFFFSLRVPLTRCCSL